MNRFAVTLSLLAVTLGAATTQAQNAYHFNVNTTTFSGQAGELDFEFNPSDISSPDATALLTNFTTDGTLGSVDPNSYGVTGALPGTVSISNTALPNQLLQFFTYGSTLSFDLSFMGTPGGGQFGSAFSLFLLDANGSPLSHTTALDDVQAAVQVAPDLSTSAETFAIADANHAPLLDSNGQQVLLTSVTVTGVPEPGIVALFGSSILGGLGLLLRRRAR